MKKRPVYSLLATIGVVMILVFAAPAQAVELGTSLPKTAKTSESVPFSLVAKLQGNENIPIDYVTLRINGPGGAQECVFSPDGAPVSGCENVAITPVETGEQEVGDLWGKGWNGTDNVGTDFGYGYGTAGPVHLKWNVQWDTEGLASGQYSVDYFLTAGGEVARQYRLKHVPTITLRGDSKASLYVKAPFPKNGNYVFVCENQIADARYDWYYGDGKKLLGIKNGDTFHSYDQGEYDVSCTAYNSTDSQTGNLRVKVTETAQGGENNGGNGGNTGNGAVCELAGAAATCKGGEIVKETLENGARVITCQNGGRTMTVKAYEKPGKQAELYLTSVVGTGLELCVGKTCLDPVKSSYAKGKLCK